MPQYLFLFTIGPVQSFISQARKTKDLWAGSRILSDLIKAAIEKVGRDHIIFPYSYPNDDAQWKKIESLPNRLVAKIVCEDAQAMGKNIEDAVRKKWDAIRQNSIGTALLSCTNARFAFDNGKDQLDSHLDIHWIFQPLGDNYTAAFEEMERNMGGIKNLRPFKQYNKGEGEQGRKCSLDGHRNIKFYRKSPRQKDKEIQNSFLFAQDNCILEYDNEKQCEIAPGEGLSAVSFVKRFYGGGSNPFPSTAEIALLSLIQKLKKEGKEGWNDFYNNPQLFYKENLNAEYFANQGIKKEVKLFEEKLQTIQGSHFGKYYAILLFDGDSMGEWLSKATSAEEHQNLSKLLIEFAQKAKAYVDDTNAARGRTVYAGGDDYLGFVTLDKLFEVLAWLRETFEKEVNDKKTIQNNGKKFTFSAGICIAHYKEPLSLVIQRARAMEHKAKDVDGKDAFAIAVIKGSGESHETVWKFGENGQTIRQIESIVKMLVEEKCSNTFIKNFERQFERLVDLEEGSLDIKLNKLVTCELSRLVKRSASENGTKDTDVINELLTNLFTLLPKSNQRNFISLLDICDFLHRQLPSPQKANKHV